MRPNCKSIVYKTPLFHSRFCVKKHVEHKKLLCSWAGGGGGRFDNAYLLPPGMKYYDSAGSLIGSIGIRGQPLQHLTADAAHEEHAPINSVPGPIVGTGPIGIALAAFVLVYLARRRQRL